MFIDAGLVIWFVRGDFDPCRSGLSTAVFSAVPYLHTYMEDACKVHSKSTRAAQIRTPLTIGFPD